MTRNSLARIQLKGENAGSEMNEEMDRLSRTQPITIPLKAAKSEHNHPIR